MKISTLKANWPAPKGVNAYTTIRFAGYSQTPYAELNLAHHVGDNTEYVIANRQKLIEELKLPEMPRWLNQIHSTIAVTAESIPNESVSAHYVTADASYTQQKNKVCVVLTADCLPILLCDQQGTTIAAVHAGWKGLLDGIISKTIGQLPCQTNQLMAWIGPAISQKNYEIGEDLYEQIKQCGYNLKTACRVGKAGHWYLDLTDLAIQCLQRSDVTNIYSSGICTYADNRFFSYRRDGKTGRIASLIWMNSQHYVN